MEENNIDELSMASAKDAAKKVKDKAVKKVVDTKDAAIREKKETILAAKILINILKKKKASPQEIQFLKKQSIDIAKIAGLMGLQFVPFATSTLLLLKTVLNKYGVKFNPFPTSNKDIIDVSKDELDSMKKELNEVIDRHVVRHSLDKLKRGDFVTVNRYGKENIVFFAGKKGDDYYATTWRPGENQTRHDEYFKLYPAKNVDLVKIGNDKVESKEDFEDRKHFYNQQKYGDAYAHSKRHPNMMEIVQQEVDKVIGFLKKKKHLEKRLNEINEKLETLNENDEVYDKSIGKPYWDEAWKKFPGYNNNPDHTEKATNYILKGMKNEFPEYDWDRIEDSVRKSITAGLT